MGNPIRLTLLEIENYMGQGRGRPSGKYLRYFCPIHGSDKQRSLSLNPDTGYFKCFACGAWGYLREEKQEWEKQLKKHAPHRTETEESGMLRSDLGGLLREFQTALPGSLGEKYLQKRGIPLELAQAYGAGYAAPGKWPHRSRKWKYGHIIFPHTNPAGEVVNLYGRAVDIIEEAPKELRHNHLPGSKGIFNAHALSSDVVFICEGVFDALSLIAAGYKNACAIFGVDGLRWEWVTARRVVFCFDYDVAGERWRQQAWDGILRGKEIFYLPKEIYAGCKDLNEVWVATGKLDIGEWNDISDNIKTSIRSKDTKGIFLLDDRLSSSLSSLSSPSSPTNKTIGTTTCSLTCSLSKPTPDLASQGKDYSDYKDYSNKQTTSKASFAEESNTQPAAVHSAQPEEEILVFLPRDEDKCIICNKTTVWRVKQRVYKKGIGFAHCAKCNYVGWFGSFAGGKIISKLEDVDDSTVEV